MKALFNAVFATLLLTACQSSQYIEQLNNINKPMLLDDKFPHYQNTSVESEQEIFALDDEMKNMVATKLKTEKDTKKRTLKLLKHIFDSEEIAISYQSNANINARQAYHNQTANCLSLTIMAYALAKEADLHIKFQQVETPEYWIRNGQYNFLTGHVNLLVKMKNVLGQTILWGTRDIQIDFDPHASKSSFKRYTINKNVVVAMFYNNKGAEALVDADFNTAYKYFKSAALIAPEFSSSWANLGVLYKLTYQIEQAEIAYRYAIKLDSNNFTAMENLAIVLTQQQKIKEAQLIRDKLQNKRNKNPYYYALLADEAFYVGNNKQAIKLYRKAIKLERKAHEFYFGLAKVYYQTGDIKLAEEALERAIYYNKTTDTDKLYLTKLNFLRNAKQTY